MEKDNRLLNSVDFSEFNKPTYEEWKEAAIVSLKGAPFEKKLLTKTYEGITLEPLYMQEHAEKFAHKDSVPGGADYLRGIEAAGYLEKPWLVVQKAECGSMAEANAVIKDALKRGGDAVAFCPRGLNLTTLADLEALLNGIDISNHPFNVFAGPTALPLLGLLQAYAAKHKLNGKAISGVIGADPIGNLVLQGKLDAELDCYFAQMAQGIRWAQQNMPQLKTIYIQSSVYHNGGANAVQELAACMSTAIAYIDALSAQGLSIEEIAGQIRFNFSLGANFFMEIAKLRAARIMWAQIIKAYGGSEAAAQLYISASTSTFTNTLYDPYVNILRSTTQAFSGVIGGVNELNVNPFDYATRQSDEQSRRIARNIQVMMQHEFDLTAPVDPVGGSWYVETLTGQLAEAAWQQMQDIEAKGGIVAALQAGTVQAAIAETLQARFKNLATRADRAVGTNMYANMQESPLDIKGRELKCTCGAAAMAANASAAAIDGSIESIAEALNKGAELASIAKALAKGNSLSIEKIAPHRWTEQFEALRDKTVKSSKEITVFLANMGPVAQHKARADFSTGFMEVGAFKVLGNNGFADVKAAAEAAIASNATATVICSTDDTYAEIVPELTKLIKAAKPNMLVILAGMPAAEHKEAYVAAGLDDSIHVKANCLEVLTKIQKAGGIA